MSKTMKKTPKMSRRGDTIVEAVIAIAIYSIVAVLALASMNSGLKNAQKNLESVMSRAAVDSQVDTIRYIYDGYIKAKEGGGKDAAYFNFLWKEIAKRAIKTGGLTGPELKDVISDPDDYSNCDDLIANDALAGSNIFALNPRALYSQEWLGLTHPTGSNISGLSFSSPGLTFDEAEKLVVLANSATTPNAITTTSLYPRLTYKAKTNTEGITDEGIANILIGSNKGGDAQPTRDAISAQGIWVDMVEEDGKNSYDFYVRTCWNAAGEKAPTTFTTVVRVYKVD